MAQKQPKLFPGAISIEPLPQDVGALEQWLFHHNQFLESEAKEFIREFEQKRGDSDVKALNYCSDLMLQMMGNLTNCKATIDASSDTIAARGKKNLAFNTLVNQTKDIVSALTPKEQLFQEQRDAVRKSKIDKEEEEKKNCEKQEIANREQIEREFKEKVVKIQEKYTNLLAPSFQKTNQL